MRSAFCRAVHLRCREMPDPGAFGEALVRFQKFVLPSVRMTAELRCVIGLDAFAVHGGAAPNAGRRCPMKSPRPRFRASTVSPTLRT